MELFTKEHDKVTGQYRGFPADRCCANWREIFFKRLA